MWVDMIIVNCTLYETPHIFFLSKLFYFFSYLLIVNVNALNHLSLVCNLVGSLHVVVAAGIFLKLLLNLIKLIGLLKFFKSH
jgi:hypothetical protein